MPVNPSTDPCALCQKPILPGTTRMRLGGRAVHGKCVDNRARQDAGPAEPRKVRPKPEIPHGEIVAPEGKSFLDYQIAGIAQAAHVLETSGVLLADEMGLGKTVQAIGLINSVVNIRRVLVVAPASLVYNWRNECAAWLARELSVGIFPEERDITIVTYEKASRLSETSEWDLLLVDEGHYCKNPDAKRTQIVQELSTRSSYTVVLTGTPIENRPLDLWPLLQMIAPRIWDPPGKRKDKKTGNYVYAHEGQGAGYWRYASRYCAAKSNYMGKWDFRGASNLEELGRKLRATCMIRRKKADVLAELPPKRRQILVVQEGATDAVDYAIDPDDYEAAKGQVLKIPFADIMRIRHEQGMQKLPLALEHCNEVLEEVDKLLVFAYHKDVLDGLRKGLGPYGVAYVDGSVLGEKRADEVARFQTSPSCHVFLGQVQAAGVGLTLTASSHVVFVEREWTPSKIDQAEDRVHRIGQTESVLIQHLVIDGSVDALMTRLIVKKQEIVKGVMDS